MKPFSLLIKPASGNCNLRCAYCFYLRVLDSVYPQAQGARMSDATLERLVKDYMALQFPVSAFCFQGGEPLVAGLDFYRRLVKLQQRFGAAGQAVGNSFQTNGVLIDAEWAEFFRRYNCLVGLSLDGPAPLHDRYRLTTGGQPTHERVLRGMKHLREHEVEFNVLTVVNKETCRHAREILDYFRSLGIHYLQFIPIVETDPQTGRVADFVMSPEEYGAFLCELWDAWLEPGFPDVSIRDFEAWIEILLGGASALCTYDTACDHYMLVEHNGDCYPCDFFCDPKYRLGNLNDTPIGDIFARPKHYGFARAKTAYPAECYSCRWLGLCHGGCVKDRMLGKTLLRGEKARSPQYFCRAYKMFFEYAIDEMVDLKDQIWAHEIAQETIAPPSPQPSRAAAKASRNAPCPCGSGRKYKNCCLPSQPRLAGTK